jgi:hypothetical protein
LIEKAARSYRNHPGLLKGLEIIYWSRGLWSDLLK